MAAASLKTALVKELETAFGLQDGNHQPELASRLEQNLIDWAKPLMQPYRYKCLWGGRGCVAAETRLETPNGLIRVDRFTGGIVYAYDRGQRIEVLAGRPVRYTPEPLYQVTLSDGTSIRVTAKHRFLSDRGWIHAANLLGKDLDAENVSFVCPMPSSPPSPLASLSSVLTLLSDGSDFSSPSLRSAAVLPACFSTSQNLPADSEHSSSQLPLKPPALPELRLDAVSSLLSAAAPQGSCFSASPSTSPSNALHCWRILLGFLYCCSEDFRQCGLLPPQAPDTYLGAVQQLAGELPHIRRALRLVDALEFERIHNFLRLLRRPSIQDGFLSLAAQYSENEESRTAAKISEQLLELSQDLEQSPLNTDPLALVHKCVELALAFWLFSKEPETLSCQTSSSLQQSPVCDIHEIQRLFGQYDDTTYSDGFGSCNHDLHCSLKPVKKIDFAGVQPFYDLFVPYFNNYLTEGGIVNHNSAKSWSVGDCLLIEGLKRRIRVLCAREFQISIKDSVHALLKARIESLGLEDFYSVQEYQILGVNGSQFIFRGVRRNVQSIKSMTGLTHCWIEEAQAISAESWQVLVPTIREEGSEIWVTFNPLHETDVVYQELVAKPRQNAYVERVNWDRNPFFPSVLDEERRSMLASDPDAYQHIWEGGFWEKSNAQVLAGKWIVEEFEPESGWAGPYQGADFGFAQDPTTLVRCWVHDGRLWVEYESYQVGLELDHTADRWLMDVPDCDRYTIRADSARPESISYLRRHGMPRIEGVKKWPGSVEDGIAHLRSYDKIVIHPRCRHTIEEARLYSYKTDRLSGEVLPVVQPGWDHGIDSLRYACVPLMKARGAAKRSGMALY